MIFVVRHAKAGARTEGTQDQARQLSRAGLAQAVALCAPLIAAGATEPLLSSPFVRCRQTLEPLARRLGTVVAIDAALGEAQPIYPLLELVRTAAEGTVLCSHGDMIPDLMSALQRRGCRFVGEPNWKKASTWVLSRNADGEVTTARCIAPPDNHEG